MRGLFGDTESLISTMAAIQSSMVSLRESLVSDIEVRRLREDHLKETKAKKKNKIIEFK